MKTELPNTPNRTRYYVLALLVLTAWGLLIRVYALGDQSLWNDEACSISIGQGIWEHGRPIVPSGIEMWRGLPNNCLIGLFLKLFGNSDFVARLPSVFFGTAMIPLAFLFAKNVTKSNKAALFAAFLTAFLSVQVAWSRQARMYQEFQFFTILALYFFHRFTETHRNRDFVLACVFLVIAILDHYFGLLILLALVAYALLENRSNIRRVFTREWLLRWQVVVTALCIAILAALAQVEFQLGTVIWREATITIWLGNYIYYFALYLFVVSVLAIAGAVALRRRNSRAAWLLVLAVVVPIYFLSFHLTDNAGFRGVYNLLPIVFVLCSFALVRVWESVPRVGVKRLLGVLLVVIIVAMMLLSSDFVFTPRRYYFDFDPAIQQPDLKAAYNYVKDNSQADDIVIDVWPVVGTWYLNKPPDYTLYLLGSRRSSRHILVRDMYTTVPAIENADMMKSIFDQSQGGWLIINDWAWKYLPDDIEHFVSHNLVKQDIGPTVEGNHGEVRVYVWRK